MSISDDRLGSELWTLVTSLGRGRVSQGSNIAANDASLWNGKCAPRYRAWTDDLNGHTATAKNSELCGHYWHHQSGYRDGFGA